MKNGRISGVLCLWEGLKLPITQKWEGTFVTQTLICDNFLKFCPDKTTYSQRKAQGRNLNKHERL